eukprot:6483909-Amphidinium_carterae.1
MERNSWDGWGPNYPFRQRKSGEHKKHFICCVSTTGIAIFPCFKGIFEQFYLCFCVISERPRVKVSQGHSGRKFGDETVLRDVNTETSIAEDIGDKEGAIAARSEWSQYVEQFLGGTQVKQAKKHRMKVFAWLRATENMLRCLSGEGWLRFRIANGSDIAPELWPSITLTVDQGTDGWSGGHYLESLGLNIMLLGDESHRLWNDCQSSIRDAGLQPYVTATTVAVNAEHGPWSSERWYRELVEASVAFANVDAGENPLLQ